MVVQLVWKGEEVVACVEQICIIVDLLGRMFNWELAFSRAGVKGGWGSNNVNYRKQSSNAGDKSPNTRYFPYLI